MIEVTNHPVKILVIEDNEDLRLMLAKLLQMKNFDLLLAENGKQALELVSEAKCPDLILLDLSMPQMDGAEFIKMIKAHPFCSSARVILVSGWDDLANLAKQFGADGFIRKPIEIDLFFAEIQKQISLCLFD